MRKDVKLGLAIGAILLAVIIVYAATPRHSKKTGVTLNTTNKTSDAGNNAGTQAPKPTDVPAPTPPDDSHPVAPPTPAPGSDAGTVAGGDAAHPPADTHTTTDWGALLRASDDQLPALIGSRTTSGQASEHPTAPVIPADPDLDADHHGGMAPDPAIVPTTQQSAGDTPRTHKVQPGETFASIAKSVYGRSSMYLAIEKANPTINPNRLRPGTVLTLPSATAASSSDEPGATSARHSHATEETIDPTKEYRVQPGDSLQRIAAKLYGNASRADELYTTNKDTIGPNPAKLKVGEILKLPEPPTATR